VATIDDYRSRAKALFDQLVLSTDPDFIPDFALGSNYWQIGCVFDTVTDYLQQDSTFPEPKVSAGDAQKALADVYSHYEDLAQYNVGDPNYCWYDDFGWWGIACSKAFDPAYADLFGDQVGLFRKIALATWETMHNGKFDHVHFGAPNVWDHCDQTTFEVCKPRFPGGVWQYDIFAKPRPWDHTPPGCNPSTPIDVVEPLDKNEENPRIYPALNLGPFQNTVTNGLYFVLANRLALTGYERAEPSGTIFGFFDKWFHDPSLAPGHRLNQPVNGGQLILERVSTYADGSVVHWWDAMTAWGGDQGLVLGALAEYKALLVSNNATVPVWIDGMIADIIGGVATAMKKVDAENGATYLMPWYPFESPFPEVDGQPTDMNKLEQADKGDYSSGTGIFMRYLNRVRGIDPAVKTALDTPGNPMRQLVLDSAAAVVAGTFPSWKNSWDNPDNYTLFDVFNRLAILVTAISLSNE